MAADMKELIEKLRECLVYDGKSGDDYMLDLERSIEAAIAAFQVVIPALLASERAKVMEQCITAVENEKTDDPYTYRDYDGALDDAISAISALSPTAPTPGETDRRRG